jgi:hypothetical protein
VSLCATGIGCVKRCAIVTKVQQNKQMFCTYVDYLCVTESMCQYSSASHSLKTKHVSFTALRTEYRVAVVNSKRESLVCRFSQFVSLLVHRTSLKTKHVSFASLHAECRVAVADSKREAATAAATATAADKAMKRANVRLKRVQASLTVRSATPYDAISCCA